MSLNNRFLTLTKEQCAELRSIVDYKMNQIDNYLDIDLLGQVFNKLSPSPITRQIAKQIGETEFDSCLVQKFIRQENRTFCISQKFQSAYQEINPACSGGAFPTSRRV